MKKDIKLSKIQKALIAFLVLSMLVMEVFLLAAIKNIMEKRTHKWCVNGQKYENCNCSKRQ